MSPTVFNTLLNIRSCRSLLFVAFATWLAAVSTVAQQPVVFSLNGANYRANISWSVKHNNVEAPMKTDFAFNSEGKDAFDVAVNFDFVNDSLPAESDVVWGVQFSSTGDMISPSAIEKRSRSKSAFQRFELSGNGQTSLLITPKIWRRNGGRFDVVATGNPIKLSFTITNNTQTAATDRNGQPNAAGRTDSAQLPANQPKSTPAAPVVSEAAEEDVAYTEAVASADTLQKIKALREFVDKYATANPKSALVAKAIKDIPLGTSVPEKKNDGSIAYNLDYAVQPVVDSAAVQGWRWNLTQSEFGKYRLTLTSLHDSIQSFKIADLGKNAPFNQPKELHPFEKISVRLAGLAGDSFRIDVRGGTPPFIVFLSQNRIPKWRQVLNSTDTVWAFSKDVCLLCKSGASTLEVYDSDLSTLLLKVDDAVHIFKINYIYLTLFLVAVILLGYFTYRPMRLFWQRYTFERRLRQIKAWELKEEKAREKR